MIRFRQAALKRRYIAYDIYDIIIELKYIITDELSTQIESNPLRRDAIFVSNTRSEGALGLEPK